MRLGGNSRVRTGNCSATRRAFSYFVSILPWYSADLFTGTRTIIRRLFASVTIRSINLSFFGFGLRDFFEGLWRTRAASLLVLARQFVLGIPLDQHSGKQIQEI